MRQLGESQAALEGTVAQAREVQAEGIARRDARIEELSTRCHELTQENAKLRDRLRRLTCGLQGGAPAPAPAPVRAPVPARPPARAGAESHRGLDWRPAGMGCCGPEGVPIAARVGASARRKLLTKKTAKRASAGVSSGAGGSKAAADAHVGRTARSANAHSRAARMPASPSEARPVSAQARAAKAKVRRLGASATLANTHGARERGRSRSRMHRAL